jgi:hypothetical protein
MRRRDRMSFEPSQSKTTLRATGVPIVIGLISVRVVVLLLAIHAGRSQPLTDDLARFREIVRAPGVPYQDFAVEYAPGELLFVRALGSHDPSTMATRMALIAFIADLAISVALWRGWNSIAAERYLWIGTPLLVFIYTRFDLVPVALITWGVVLALQGRERTGGLWAAVAILTKLWPVVLMPAFAIMRRKRTLAWCFVSTATALVTWATFAGSGGVFDVLTFRHAAGWGVESVIGTLVWIFGRGPVVLEAGAPRTGAVPSWAPVVLGLVLAAWLAAIWWAAAKRRSAAFGAASVAALGAVLSCSPVFSLQYVSWLLPWAAIAWLNQDDRWAFRAVAAISILTGGLFVVYSPDRVGISQALLVCRNVLTIALPIAWLLRGRLRAKVAA